jgi:glyoxylase-like metal-dependent hydrolase (beta-lactamase superfamily II)
MLPSFDCPFLKVLNGRSRYLVADGASGQCATVDACWDCAGIKRVADELGLTIVAAWYTHKHFDHGGGAVPERMTGGAKVTLEGAQNMAALGAEVVVGSADAVELQQQCGLASLTPVEEGTQLTLGGLSCTVLSTPGHTPGSVCFQVGDCLFTGDTLFVGSCGRVDLPGSNPEHMHASLQRLAALPDDLTVLPGHDYGPSPSNKIGGEKATNMMIREAMMHATPAGFAASLRNLSAPKLLYTAADAKRRLRKGPTGTAVQAVTIACCSIYAGAGDVAGSRDGKDDTDDETSAFARFYCADLRLAALQPGTKATPPSL